MMVFSMRQVTPRRAAVLGACVALALVAVALVAGCGSSGSSKAAAKTSGRTVQVLATVRRGNLVETVTGRVQLTSTKSKATGVVQVAGQNASQVAAGQPVTLTFVQLPSGASQGQSGQGFTPPAGQSGQSQNSQGAQGTGGQAAFRGGKTAQGTVTSVKQGSSGSVTATITIAKLPAGVTAKYIGIAQIQLKVLASNVLIVATAAIKGSGSNATVQLLANGKTQTQSVMVGQHNQTESEITSGLSVGESVIYTRTFTGGFPGGGSGQPSGQGFPQGGAAPSGNPPAAPVGGQ